MDKQALDAFAAYCRLHKITFAIHGRGESFRLEFSAENDEDVQELLKYLKGKIDADTTEQQLLD